MKIGISSCLLGNRCRYNGADSKDRYIVDVLGRYFEFVPFCPEDEVFSTPRDAIRLVDIDGDIKVKKVKDSLDVTKELKSSSKNLVDRMSSMNLCGFILKSKSPSCGLERVKVYEDNSYMCEKRGVGVFAEEILDRFEYLPVEDEGRLNDEWLKENFLMQVFAYGSLYKFLNSNPSYKDLVEFHTEYKYLIYSKSNKSYKILGNIVANHQKLDFDEVLLSYRDEFLKSIAIKGSIKKTYNVLLHIFGYFKKELSKDEKKEILNSLDEFKAGVIPLISVIKSLTLCVARFDNKYLKKQKFLYPYPKELGLRSTVKAYK
jgi:uncharacterized protein YbgA (DUF1722 family)/uncharacterized protein YbbK (DUF523 family)